MANPATSLAQQAAQYAQQQGPQLLDQFGNTEEDQKALEDWYQNQTGNYAQRMMGEGGYTPDQAEGVLGTSEQSGVPSLGDLSGVSSQEAQSDFLTPEQEQSIEGDPYAAYDNLGGAFTQEDSELGYGQGQQDAAVTQEKQDLGAAIDPSKLSLSSDYAGNVQDQLGATNSALNSATSNPALQVMGDYASKEEMSPQQQQDIINAAGTSVANKNQSALEQQERQANAAGIGTLGQEALAGRMNRQAESDAADAETQARIEASNAAAQRLQTVQGTELGAAQTQAGMQEQAGEYEGTTGLSALQNTEQMRMGAQQDISSRQLQAAEESGREDIANTQAETGQVQGALQNQTALGTSTNQQAEQAAATRAATVATNTQQTQQGINAQNNARGVAANNALGSRYGQVGNTQLQAQEYGGQLESGLANTSSQNMNTAGSQQLGALQATTGAENQSAGVESGAQNQPGTGTKVLGGILGGLSSAASFFDEGGIVTEPTEGVLGESGPEAVVPLGGDDLGDNADPGDASPLSSPLGSATSTPATQMAAPRHPFLGIERVRKAPVHKMHTKMPSLHPLRSRYGHSRRIA